MPRRGMNIYKRKDGRWEGRIKKDEKDINERKYLSVYGKTYTEVKNKMDQLKNNKKKSKNGCSYNIEQAIHIWLKDRGSHWKPTTYATYQHMAQKHIVPKLGVLKVAQVNNQVIEKFITDIRCDKDGNLLSSGYLHNICAVVIKALLHMKKVYRYDFEIPDNPIAKSKQNQVMLPGEYNLAVLEKHLLANKQNHTCLGILIALYTGIRIGELCALTWNDINLIEEVIYIRKNMQRVKNYDGQKNRTKILFQTPKTRTSERIIPIPPILLKLLIAQKGEGFQYILMGQRSSWTEPRTLQYQLARILNYCGIEQFNFHILRHAFATRCIAKGFDVKSLSEILGHSNVQITLNLYVHSSIQRKKQLMQMFDLYLHQSFIAVV